MGRAFLKSPLGVTGLFLVLLLAVAAIVFPMVFGAESHRLNYEIANQTPSGSHLLGTDGLGRDILTRIAVGTRLTLLVSLAATGIGAAIGTLLGGIAPILPRFARTVLLRAIDALIAFPALLIAIFIATILGPSATTVAIGTGVGLSFSFGRITSTLALSVGGREYIATARVLGIRASSRLFRHVLPNIAETLMITTTVSIAASVVTVSSLSFLGLGVQAPEFDWGAMLTQGVQTIYLNPAGTVGPAVAIALAALAFGLVGEALARAMDPQSWTVRRARGQAGLALVPPPSVGSMPILAETDSSSIIPSTPCLEVSHLVVDVPRAGGDVRILSDISFTIGAGERLGIVGESGSGKTMTGMAIAQLLRRPLNVQGTIRIDGRDVATIPKGERRRFMGRQVGVVFQDPASSLNPALRIRTQLTEAVRAISGVKLSEAMHRALEKTREVNLPSPERELGKHPHQFSGGMRQRIMLAMALINHPKLVIADEPTTALDVTIQAQIMELFQQINLTHGTAFILITHNLALVSQNCDRVVVMYAGRIVEDAQVDQLVEDPKHPYTRMLLASIPSMIQPKDIKLTDIPGDPPDFAHLPTGCAFSPRCPLAMEKCLHEMPPLAPIGNNRLAACWVAQKEVPLRMVPSNTGDEVAHFTAQAGQ